MSSVTRFIRQVPLSTTYYNATIVAANPTTYVYEFIPSSSNYVGNYPNGFNDATGGYVTTASAALIAAIGEAVAAAAGPGNLVLRDLGKTIFAPIGNSANPSWSYFRQVQLLAPSAISQTAPATSFMGGVNGPTFGVLGAANVPDAYTDYLTFYIPVTVAGIGLTTAASSAAYALAGGQM